MRRIAVTGMGIVSSIGNNVSEVATALWKAQSGITFSEDFARLGFRCQVWGKPDLNEAELVDRKAMRFLSQGGMWGHIAMQQAIADSGLDQSEITHERTGLIVGSGGPSTKCIVDSAQLTQEHLNTRRVGPFAVPKAMSSTASANLSTWFKILGTSYSISSACSTSAHCIGNAAELIQSGKQDIMFAGGQEDLDWTMSNLFDAMGAMSSHFNDNPCAASRPYDSQRDGFVISGGAAILVMEEMERAKARGAKIYAELSGYGSTCDGCDMVSPSGEGAVRCMRQALSSVQNPIDYINTHGTATLIGDKKEIEAIKEVFKDDIPHIQSTKSLTGHSLGAAGAQEAIYSLIMMQKNFIGESKNIEEIDPEFKGLPIVRKRIDNVQIDTVLSNSFGFGGTNATLVFQRYKG
ncbi:3-oxoacyl-ACP synthase [Candidatus Liberibacter solanacearum]|uniref:3-oxoacyl-[acyl-carrier-protein] synthase 1 n=1 Tax=Candidatus Liberibacter solanacearum TaxID=556287 RepID=A0A094Z111_9HYPH|nr:beta-ketoacyl-ACP synthase I [Candidatus Liberibacter solanacearum]KGB27900.1 3-oxoacyl-ACP synthase [Candidatus Liberibacter solanacearum]KJZ81033.1 3-oxoacyl-ACP synthase [Candidatus Liberibacter solanacearum]KJZ82213.1 3-oxoacyl-[acyl-carrier-protein] synthase, KASI [Candidatus Liberibacter solanacearum]KQC49364.1 3-oxoacyl-ACP synthase [Candidatus Liberibacter solanacearum]